MGAMHRLPLAVAISFAVVSSPSQAKPPGLKAPQPPRPNAIAQCSMTFTAPSAYSRDFTTGDYCKLATLSTPVILFGPAGAASAGT